ncbi:MAG: DUF177 domain-containing protein [Acidobacteriia bacterium]|nr:DUF177 domain-containing protein [Terriglobia bacterium]
MLIALKDLAVQPVVISEVLRAGAIDLRSPDFRQVGVLIVEAVASLVSDEIRVQGELQVRIEMECSRCLERMEVPVQKTFDLFYRPSRTLQPTSRGEEIELRRPELDVGFFVGDKLEFNDALRELILIEMPMKAMCRPDCLGLCLQCGTNLNTGTCACSGGATDPRWAQLKASSK